MTTERQVEILATLSTRDESGKHFMERYSFDELSELEEAGLIVIDRPIHAATGIAYSQDNWSVEVTAEGCELVANG